MPIPQYPELMLPVLRLINDGRTNIPQCLPSIKTQYNITEDEAKELLPSKRATVLANRAHWARFFLGKAGLLQSPRKNVHVVTERGRALLATNPDHIDEAMLRKYSDYAAWRRNPDAQPQQQATSVPDEPELGAADQRTQTPEEAMEANYAVLDSALVTELQEALSQLSPQRFERLILDLLSAMGYGGGDLRNASLTPAVGDGGIDGIINEDALGLDAVYIQAKRYTTGKVGRPDCQRFVGALGGVSATKGVFVTTSEFSPEAQEYIRLVPHRIIMINGLTLAKLMIQHGVGVRVRTTYVVRSVDEDYFSEEDTAA